MVIGRLPYRRVIPCLDFKDGRIVKGIQFVDLVDAGDPVEMAEAYLSAGADELVLLDIAASVESRPTVINMATAISEQCKIPFVVGGGMSSVDDIGQILTSGADKISINSAAIRNPQLVLEAAQTFGQQKIIIAIDAKRVTRGMDKWTCMISGGRSDTGIDVLDWAYGVTRHGAGEILLTSMDADGAQDGYDLALTRAVARHVDIPVIASGGAGKLEHFAEGILEGEADAVLAASVFHFGIISIRDVKHFLASQKISVRMEQ
ncbi:MAG: imidazole glycerol phosphate synthase subunit HisF [Coriobacteriales bacterium]|jgi:cyclase|nr:imidazole glycerol phosphate synthase subunit HisF [Coriobacteriales bacterium]